MALTKSNEFLDASDSEEEQLQTYDSDDDLRKGGRIAKRRKVDASDNDLSDDDDGGAPLAKDDKEKEESDEEAPDDEDGEEGRREDADGDVKSSRKKGKVAASELDILDPSRPLKKNLVATPEAIKKSGVVYLSRIPPFMKPAKLRSLLEPYGTINRIFLAPEDDASRARRLRAGGNKKRIFTEGWVEFVKKKHGKAACELLNARTIGGKKGSYYRDDLWNLVYLKGFKWHNLTEQIAAENAERASRMRAEISKSTKENRDFVRNVERAKMLDGMQAKPTRKRRLEVEEDNDQDKAGEGSGRKIRSFEQTRLAKKENKTDQPEHVTRVLSKIF